MTHYTITLHPGAKHEARFDLTTTGRLHVFVGASADRLRAAAHGCHGDTVLNLPVGTPYMIAEHKDVATWISLREDDLLTEAFLHAQQGKGGFRLERLNGRDQQALCRLTQKGLLRCDAKGAFHLTMAGERRAKGLEKTDPQDHAGYAEAAKERRARPARPARKRRAR